MAYLNNGVSCYSSDEETAETGSFDANTEPPRSAMQYDDSRNKEALFNFFKTALKAEIMSDVTIEIQNRTYPAHKLILAAASKKMYDMFQSDTNLSHYVLNDVDSVAFQYLLDYAYTYRLEVETDDVVPVYKAAIQLQMQSAAEACSKFLATHLTTSSCIDVRQFAKQLSDPGLASQTKHYIQENIEEVLSESHVETIQIVVLGNDALLGEDEMKTLGQLVLEWLKASIVLENEYLLCITDEKELKDVKQLQDDDEIATIDAVIDFKANSKKWQAKAQYRLDRPSVTNGKEEVGEIIAVRQVSDNHFVFLADINDETCRISIKYDIAKPKTGRKESGSDSDTSLISNSSSRKQLKQPYSFIPLNNMQTARSGVGVVHLDEGRLVAIGGYDRAFCLDSGEIYDVSKNIWTAMPNMLSARARFNVALLNGRLYACGGSNGNRELDSAEFFDLATNKWKYLPTMMHSRLFAGVTALQDSVCVIGGWAYQGLVDCEMYKPAEGRWTPMRSMNVGRSQAAVTTLNGRIIAAGGADNWSCLHAVELYDEREANWEVVAPLSTPRRGAGATVLGDKLYVVGGSDGKDSLTSVEIYDMKTNSWSMGPNLNQARTNLGVAVVGDCIYAVGGFSGKEFLQTMEVLRGSENEWSCFTTHQP